MFGPDGSYDLNFIRVNAQERFYEKLKGVEEPEHKRKIIGEEFIRVFEEEAKKIGAVDFLVQGTIYPDVVESGVGGESTVIKSHHNVGGLPDYVDFKEIIEPLRNLFKDEVRKAGLELGIPEYLVFRQPFPGPGLGIRIIGEITAEKVKMVQDADAIWREEIAAAGWDKKVNQYFAALTNMRSVGVMGDERTYDYAVALRAVTTTDFMTAESAEIPWEVIGRTTSRIINEVKHVNRVLYDCTGNRLRRLSLNSRRWARKPLFTGFSAPVPLDCIIIAFLHLPVIRSGELIVCVISHAFRSRCEVNNSA